MRPSTPEKTVPVARFGTNSSTLGNAIRFPSFSFFVFFLFYCRARLSLNRAALPHNKKNPSSPTKSLLNLDLEEEELLWNFLSNLLPDAPEETIALLADDASSGCLLEHTFSLLEVIELLSGFLESNGVWVQGILRIPCSQIEKRALISLLNQGMLSWSLLSRCSIHGVASLFKEVLSSGHLFHHLKLEGEKEGEEIEKLLEELPTLVVRKRRFLSLFLKDLFVG